MIPNVTRNNICGYPLRMKRGGHVRVNPCRRRGKLITLKVDNSSAARLSPDNIEREVCVGCELGGAFELMKTYGHVRFGSGQFRWRRAGGGVERMPTLQNNDDISQNDPTGI